MSLPISFLSCLPDAHKCTVAFLCSPSDPLPLGPGPYHRLLTSSVCQALAEWILSPEMQQAGLFSLGLLVPTLLDISSLLCFTLITAVAIV